MGVHVGESIYLSIYLSVVAPERVTNENTNTDIKYQIILHKKELHRKGKKSRTVRITAKSLGTNNSEKSP